MDNVNVMSNVKALAGKLLSLCEKTEGKAVPMQFNVLDQMHANENAHTRILMNLLRDRRLCKSFLDYINGKELAKVKLPSLERNERLHVSCFGDYLDGRIEIGEGEGHKFIVVENKVKDACDQDAQIDRYVQTAQNNVKDQNIFVIYLTKRGGFPVSSSFDHAKKILGYNSEEDTGRFIAMNYQDHILDWLQNEIKLSPTEIAKEPLLISGLAQYIHYIQGPELLCCRTEEDPNFELKCKLNDELAKVSCDDLVVVGTSLKFDLYKRRACAVLGRTGLVSCQKDAENTVAENAIILKRAFYSSFNEAIADDQFYKPVVRIVNAKVLVGQWTTASIVQVDVCYEEGCEGYDNFVCRVMKELEPGLTYEYNGKTGCRYYIDSLEQVDKIVAALKSVAGLVVKPYARRCLEHVAEQPRVGVLEECISARLLDLGAKVKELMWDSVDVPGRHTVDHSYSWDHKKWHLQLIEGFESGDPCRSIELFPTRGCDTCAGVHKAVEDRSVEYPFCCEAWNGRVVYRYPVTSQEYARELCLTLFYVLDDLGKND